LILVLVGQSRRPTVVDNVHGEQLASGPEN
jgi:hypothetical protein